MRSSENSNPITRRLFPIVLKCEHSNYFECGFWHVKAEKYQKTIELEFWEKKTFSDILRQFVISSNFGVRHTKYTFFQCTKSLSIITSAVHTLKILTYVHCMFVEVFTFLYQIVVHTILCVQNYLINVL